MCVCEKDEQVACKNALRQAGIFNCESETIRFDSAIVSKPSRNPRPSRVNRPRLGVHLKKWWTPPHGKPVAEWTPCSRKTANITQTGATNKAKDCVNRSPASVQPCNARLNRKS